MLDRGMAVTVNSDDPAYFPGYMFENLLTVQREVDLVEDHPIAVALGHALKLDGHAAQSALRP